MSCIFRTFLDIMSCIFRTFLDIMSCIFRTFLYLVPSIFRTFLDIMSCIFRTFLYLVPSIFRTFLTSCPASSAPFSTSCPTRSVPFFILDKFYSKNHYSPYYKNIYLSVCFRLCSTLERASVRNPNYNNFYIWTQCIYFCSHTNRTLLVSRNY